MRHAQAAALILALASSPLALCAQAPPSAGAWADPATWTSVHPTETDNIVYANVLKIRNPSAEASPNPGTPGGIRAPIPNTGAPGTMDLHLDVYQVASAKPTPVVLQFHGGGWIRGDRPSSYRGFSALLAAGMSVVTVEYRNAIDSPAPAAIGDARCAMAWVKANAAKYNFDTSRVITYGGSAGGNLAQAAAYMPASFNPPGCTDQPHVVAVLDFYGVTDLVRALTQHGSADSVHQWLGMELPLPQDPAAAAAPALTGVDAPVNAPRRAPTRWPTPTAEVLARAREMSPITYVRPGQPPTFIVNGDSDPSVDPAQDAELKAALDAAHIPNGQDIVPGGKHGNFGAAEDAKAMLLCLQFLKANGILN